MQTTQRGITTYKMLLFDGEDVVAMPPADNARTGRNAELIVKRDDFLLHRVYFKSSVQRKLYSDVLNELEREFFLTKRMLQDIIQRKSETLLQIKRSKPAIKDLKDKWPHIVWA